MAQRQITNLSTFNNYGMSRLRTGFTTIEGTASIDGNEAVTGGMLMALAIDIQTQWGMFNGSPDAGNELVDNLGTPITKQFFQEIGLTSSTSTGNYAGSANYSQSTPNAPSQHVMLFQTTNESLPNSGTVSRGLDQNYRIRFELDLRHRLYHNFSTATGDREFADELYQLNLRMDSLGYYHYAGGNQINEQLSTQSLVKSCVGLDQHLIQPPTSTEFYISMWFFFFSFRHGRMQVGVEFVSV